MFREPSLRFHKASGQYVVDIPNPGSKPKTTYLGKDKDIAETRRQALVGDLRRAMAVVVRSAPVTVLAAPRGVTVQKAADALIEFVVSQHVKTGVERRRWTTQCLKPLTERHGPRDIAALTTDDLEAIQKDLNARLSPKTANSYMQNIKRCVRYSVYKKWREPMELSFIVDVAVPAPKPKHLTVEQVRDMLNKARSKLSAFGNGPDPVLYNALRLQLLTAARMSECVRLLQRKYSIIEPQVYMLETGKTDESSSHPRCLVLPKVAEGLLAETRVKWRQARAYLFKCKRCTGRPPKFLRHTGAFLIHRMPERLDRETTDLILGHYPGNVSLVYNPIDWPPLIVGMEKYAGHLATLMPEHFCAR